MASPERQPTEIPVPPRQGTRRNRSLAQHSPAGKPTRRRFAAPANALDVYLDRLEQKGRRHCCCCTDRRNCGAA